MGPDLTLSFLSLHRILEDAALDLEAELERELQRQEVIIMEEQERERRIRAEKTKAADYTGHFSGWPKSPGVPSAIRMMSLNFLCYRCTRASSRRD